MSYYSSFHFVAFVLLSRTKPPSFVTFPTFHSLCEERRPTVSSRHGTYDIASHGVNNESVPMNLALVRRIGMFAMLALSTTHAGTATAVSWSLYMGIGRGYPECESTVKRLNRFHWDVVEEADKGILASYVISTNPLWSPLDWSDLDPNQHQDLIRKLMSYEVQGGRDLYFDRRPPRPNEAFKKRLGNEYLQMPNIPQGVRLQAARHHIVQWLDDRPAPNTTQTFVRLLSPSDQGLWERLRTRYKEFELPTIMPLETPGFQHVFMVTEDMSGPHSGLANSDAQILLQGVYLIKGRGRYVGGSGNLFNIYMSDGSLIVPFCALLHKPRD